ncbi:MAG: FAD-dependent oxidoreductase [Pseudomonadota bacterium]
MAEASAKTVAVVGAGIVGVSTAIWLQRDGHKVILIDREGPAAGTSYGNGGVLASCSCVPVTGPGLIKKAPKMALDPNQPLFVKWGYFPKLAPWLLKYLSHANAADTKRIAAAVAGIVGDSLADHQALAEGTGAERWITPCDYVYVYNDRAQFEGDRFAWDIRKSHGFEWDELEGADFNAYDPIFEPKLGMGIRMDNHGRITDPGQYVKDLAAYFERAGGEIRKAAVEDVILEDGAVSGLRAGGETIDCDACVLATGVWSGPLAKKLGVTVPLETERGYHIDLWDPSFMPKAPVMVTSEKFVATPMEGRLRLAGVVEFGGLDAAPSRAPFDLLKRSALKAMPGLTFAREEEWMGHRPAPADSIPVIGEAPGAKGAFMGFGHHHIGLTGGPKTGRLLAQLISGRKPNIDVSVYSPARWSH